MTDLTGIMIVLFIIIGGGTILVAYRPVWKRLKDCYRNRRKQTAEKNVGKNFRNSLTPQLLERLNSMEGKYE